LGAAGLPAAASCVLGAGRPLAASFTTALSAFCAAALPCEALLAGLWGSGLSGGGALAVRLGACTATAGLALAVFAGVLAPALAIRAVGLLGAAFLLATLDGAIFCAMS